MKKKVALSEQELRRIIRASLLEQDGDATGDINVYSPIDSNAVIGDDALLQNLKSIVEKFEGLVIARQQPTGVQYKDFIASAASKLGLASPLGNWDDTNPRQSQFEIISAYLKFSVILLLEREDLTVNPISITGSKSDFIVPYIKVESDPNFYTSSSADPRVTRTLDFIRTKLYDGAQTVNYRDKAFFDKLGDAAFVQQVNDARIQVSGEDANLAFTNFIGEKEKEKLAEIARADLEKNLGPLKETWLKLQTATYENYFVIPVNIPNIWQAVVNNPTDPFYNPWRESWVVCNMINKGIALPGGAAALAAMLYKANTSGLSMQSSSYRPDESKAAAMSMQPLSESKRILVTHSELRRIIAAALHEHISRQRVIVSESTGGVFDGVGKWFKDIFTGGDAAEAAAKAASDLLSSTGKQNVLSAALSELDTVGSKLIKPESIAAIKQSLSNGAMASSQLLDDFAKNSPDALRDPGSVEEVIRRPCVATFQGIGAGTDPRCVEAARQILNNSARYAIAQGAESLDKMAEIGRETYKIIQRLNDTEKRVVDRIIEAAEPNAAYFPLPANWDALPLDRVNDAIDKSVVQGLVDKLEAAYKTLGESIASSSKIIAKQFVSDPYSAYSAAQEGVQATVGKGVLDFMGHLKYSPEQMGVLRKYVGGIFYAGDRYVVSLPLKMGAEALARNFQKYPRIANAFDKLMRLNVVRSLVAKQLAAYVLAFSLSGLGATGISYEDSPILFCLERLSDTNILSASLAEIIAAGISEGLRDDEPAFLTEDFANALVADPQIISDILMGAVDHLTNGIKIPDGAFPELQEGVVAKESFVLDALSTISKFANYSGEARRRFAARAKAEVDAATAQAVSAKEAVAQTPSQKMDALESLRKATTESTKKNISDALSGVTGYVYKAPPNAEPLLQDYSKNRLDDSLSPIGIVAAARNIDEIKILNYVLDENIRLMPDAQAFKTIAALEQGQDKEISEPTQEDIAMVQAIKKLGAAISARQNNAAPAAP
jgi:hypothetical protein